MYQMCFNAFDKAANLDVLDHPILNFIYYLVSFGSWSHLMLAEEENFNFIECSVIKLY